MSGETAFENGEPRRAALSVSHRRRAFEEIVFQIQEAIHDGTVERGDRLPSERELATMFKVSRASVREALRVLEMFGVVAARRGTGAEAGSTIVADTHVGLISAFRLHSSISKISLDDLVELRVLLEAHAADRAALDPHADTSAMRELVEQMSGLAPLPFHELDTSFHIELARTSGNALLPVLMDAFRSTIEREMVKAFGQLAGWKRVSRRLNSEHLTIVECIEKGDADGASKAVSTHIVRFYRSSSRARRKKTTAHARSEPLQVRP